MIFNRPRGGAGSDLLDEQAGVVAAETEGVGARAANGHGAGHQRDVVQVALRIGLLEVDGRRRGREGLLPSGSLSCIGRGAPRQLWA